MPIQSFFWRTAKTSRPSTRVNSYSALRTNAGRHLAGCPPTFRRLTAISPTETSLNTVTTKRTEGLSCWLGSISPQIAGVSRISIGAAPTRSLRRQWAEHSGRGCLNGSERSELRRRRSGERRGTRYSAFLPTMRACHTSRVCLRQLLRTKESGPNKRRWRRCCGESSRICPLLRKRPGSRGDRRFAIT